MTTAGEGQVDEGVSGHHDVLCLSHQRRDLFAGNLSEEAVSAHEEAIAVDRSLRRAVELNLWCNAECPGENATVRMISCLAFGELPAPYGFRSHAVVVGQLQQRATTQHVSTAVAHVHDSKAPVVNEASDTDRCTHAL